jgi:ArsR family transcriptional regulator, arsenate/arsenite/antimonite-responsive transcriptional repressor
MFVNISDWRIKMKHKYAEYVPILKALSDETRLKIVDMLSCEQLCACKILERFSISQPTLSYHMKILTACDLVHARRDGAWMKYTLNYDKSRELAAFIKLMISDKEACIFEDK